MRDVKDRMDRDRVGGRDDTADDQREDRPMGHAELTRHPCLFDPRRAAVDLWGARGWWG